MTLPITVRSEEHRRLMVLAKFLRDNVDEEHYDHKHWVCAIEPVDEIDKADVVEKRKAPVPVVCCAAGWACTIKEFQKAGLYMEFESDGDVTEPAALHGLYGNPAYESEDIFGEPRTRRGVFALSAFFGIPVEDVGQIFLNYGYHHRTDNNLPIRPLDVAMKIEEYVYSRETNQP